VSDSQAGSSLPLAGARVLVTGLRSFTGHYLADALQRHGAQVFGTVAPFEAKPDDDAQRIFVANLMDTAALATAVQAVKPTHVVHLAAISFVAHGDVDDIYRTNIVGTRNLLAALHANEVSSSKTHAATTLRCALLASSANIYGNADVDPISESTPPKPANDYAVSKLAMESMASLWRDKLPITIVRPFNYTGAGQSINFLVPKIVHAFQTRQATLELGNLDVERDFSDVRDVTEIYARLLAQPPQRAVNVCSGQATSLREILAMAQNISGHTLDVQVNPAFVRVDDVKRLRGDAAHLRATLQGWQPKSLHNTLRWMLETSPQTP
jgi:GDP-6-deoxy-D-talose 4-dehydrogenase